MERRSARRTHVPPYAAVIGDETIAPLGRSEHCQRSVRSAGSAATRALFVGLPIKKARPWRVPGNVDDERAGPQSCAETDKTDQPLSLSGAMLCVKSQDLRRFVRQAEFSDVAAEAVLTVTVTVTPAATDKSVFQRFFLPHVIVVIDAVPLCRGLANRRAVLRRSADSFLSGVAMLSAGSGRYNRQGGGSGCGRNGGSEYGNFHRSDPLTGATVTGACRVGCRNGPLRELYRTPGFCAVMGVTRPEGALGVSLATAAVGPYRTVRPSTPFQESGVVTATLIDR